MTQERKGLSISEIFSQKDAGSKFFLSNELRYGKSSRRSKDSEWRLVTLFHLHLV